MAPPCLADLGLTGAERQAERAVFHHHHHRHYRLPYLLLLGLATGVQAVMPVLPTPILGWSSWNCLQQNVNETIVRAMADALVARGLVAAGYVYVNIDDGVSVCSGPN
jgi:hypothetical protein